MDADDSTQPLRPTFNLRSLTKDSRIQHHVMMHCNTIVSMRETAATKQDRDTHTIMGPSTGTFSATVVCTSERKDQTAQRASFQRKLCCWRPRFCPPWWSPPLRSMSNRRTGRLKGSQAQANAVQPWKITFNFYVDSLSHYDSYTMCI